MDATKTRYFTIILCAPDTGFFTKDLLIKIDEFISKFPPIESFPTQNFDMKYCYQDILRSHFNRLAKISFGTAKESDSKIIRYETLTDLGKENLRFLVDSNVIKLWEIDEKTHRVTLTLCDL